MSDLQLNMIPFQQPQDYDRFKAALENMWTPFQIPMGYDKEQYETVDPVIKRIALINLANLTTSDVEIMDNCALGLQSAMTRLGIADAPETRMFLNMQSFQEALHTMSYQHIIESLGLTEQEQHEFYNMWQEVPSIRNKVEFAADITSKLMSDKITMEDFLEYAIFYWLFYEGGWFFSGFNINFALTHSYTVCGRPLFSGTAEQLEYIFRDETLHIAFGESIINRIGTQHVDTRKIYNIAVEILAMESKYAGYIFQKPIIGYSAERHIEFLRYIIGRRLKSIGKELPAFNAQDKEPWRSQFTIKKEKNFFEKHVTEYRSGAQLNWD